MSHPEFHFEDQLTDDQRSFFDEQGFIQFKHFVNRATIASFLSEVARVQAELLEAGTEEINGIPLKFGEDVNGERLIQRLAFTSQSSETLSTFLKSERLKALLGLIGPYEARISETEKDGLVVNHYVNTPSSSFKQLGWHTDSPRDWFLGTRIKPMLNVGLHLDDCPISHGGLRLIPGTHKQGLFGMLFRKPYFVGNKPDKQEIGFEIEAGDLTVHDGRLWHRVQQSPLQGEASRRRVMYIPVVTGPYQPKHAASPTPLYHRIGRLLYNGRRRPGPPAETPR
jgi:ectoine hydroxylase-related dioxygenase (phytanoyl-CoA dioxygenase family)